jgi:hypothetical protein
VKFLRATRHIETNFETNQVASFGRLLLQELTFGAVGLQLRRP